MLKVYNEYSEIVVSAPWPLSEVRDLTVSERDYWVRWWRAYRDMQEPRQQQVTMQEKPLSTASGMRARATFGGKPM